MESFCKYCESKLVDITNEGLQCGSCEKNVHFTCLKRGTTPGGLKGDVFFSYTCFECSDANKGEIFIRNNLTWFEVLNLVLYNMNENNQALSRKGFFRWRTHLGSFINRHWEILFGLKMKQKKNWLGTISGMLSNHSPHFFTSGALVLGASGWWNLTFPKLSPNVISKLNLEFGSLKLELKAKGVVKSDLDLVKEILEKKNYPKEFIQPVSRELVVNLDKPLKQEMDETNEVQVQDIIIKRQSKSKFKLKRNLLPTVETFMQKRLKLSVKKEINKEKVIKLTESTDESNSSTDFNDLHQKSRRELEETGKCPKFQDPMSHYNTCLSSYSSYKFLNLQTKLTGGLREETFLSPYSNLYLKPYIYRDSRQKSPLWLKLMTQILLRTHKNQEDYVLPDRSTIDYVYVQPCHVPAINSLCGQFFWPGIDLSDSLQYPDFSVVVLYKRLVIGFAFIVPDVDYHENYISFIFVRPEWRNIGLGRFMIYHLIQTSMGKDVTLHVAINNPALFLYQKFGFKTERVELNFYDKYLPNDSYESKHAFFCRLER